MGNQNGEQHQGQEKVVIQTDRGHFKSEQIELFAQIDAEEMNGVNLIQALGTIGDVDRLIQVVQKHANDFTKAQSDNGQIITTQFQSRCAQQHAKQTRQRSAHRHNHPQGHVQTTWKHGRNGRKSFNQMRRGQQTIHVRAHRKEGHITQVKQASVADHNVQPHGQENIQQGHVGNSNPGVTKLLQDQWQHKKRNAKGHEFCIF